MKENRPNYIVNYKDLNADENSSVAVGKKLGLSKIGVQVEALPPGSRTSMPLAKSTEEEFAYVIKGHPHLWVDGVMYALSAGDIVAFPAGTAMAHTLINNSNDDALILIGAEANKHDNKIFYPLNLEKNLELQTKGAFWDNHPIHELGPHEAIPDLQKEK